MSWRAITAALLAIAVAPSLWAARARAAVSDDREKGKGIQIRVSFGPELSKIGSIRAPVDLLESVVYPSATIVRGYETYIVQTKDGRSFTGLLAHETADAVFLKTADRNEVRVARAAVDSIAPGKQSIMPQGLEGKMSRDELRDLIAFLKSLK